MPVNPNKFYIKDTETNLWLIVYSPYLENCGWGNLISSVEFNSQEEADNAITSWGQEPGARYVGQNPPPR